MLVSELARIADHIICVGVNAVDIGAFTVFLYLFKQREVVYDLFEMAAGQRMHTSFTRIGGLMRDIPPEFEPLCETFLIDMERSIDEMEALLTRNPIWADRTKGWARSLRRTPSIGATPGPACAPRVSPRTCARPSPTWAMKPMTSTFPSAPPAMSTTVTFRYRGDDSLRIVRQALAKLKEIGAGPVIIDDYKIALPPKEKVYTRMESLIHQFKLVMHSIDMPWASLQRHESGERRAGYCLVFRWRQEPLSHPRQAALLSYLQQFRRAGQRTFDRERVAILAP